MSKHKTFLPIVVILFLCVALAASWRWTSLAQWLDVSTVSAWLDLIRTHPAAPYLVIAVFVIGSQIMFPVTILIFASAYTFGPRIGFTYAMLGSLSGAVVSYWIGYWLGHEAFRRMAGSRYQSLEQILKKNGLVAVITTHLIPVGPFTIVNLAAGAVGVTFWHFVLG
ncbi:MAG: TVP38/TMEM64 family protein, partial [Candidatus Binatia bacterium]